MIYVTFVHNARAMFTYIDPTVRQRLEASGKLFKIPRAAGGTISALGPIPMPLHIAGERIEVAWFATVRNTELTRLEDLAAELRSQHGERSFAELASSMAVNSVLVIGDRDSWASPLIRVHSSCLTGDVFGSERCECGPQLHSAIELINKDDQGGLLIYMAGHEGRGIGLFNKIEAYCLQDRGFDTIEANEELGLSADSRCYQLAGKILGELNVRSVRLLTNNPLKIEALRLGGIEITRRVPVQSPPNHHNSAYLATKKQKMAHLL